MSPVVRGRVARWLWNSASLSLVIDVGGMGCSGPDSNTEPDANVGTSSAAGGTGGAANGAAETPANGGTSPVAAGGANTGAGGSGASEGIVGDEPLSGGGSAGMIGSPAAGAGSDMPGAPSEDDGTIAFDPPEAVYSVALSVTTAGVTKVLALRNTFASPVVLSTLAVSGRDAASFILEGAPPLPVTVATGDSLSVTVRFRPPVNSGTNTFLATVSAAKSDDDETSASITAGLYGLAMSPSNAEATLSQVVTTLGFDVDVGSTSIALGTDSAPVGEEVLARRFIKAEAATPVRLEPMARYSPMEAADYGYYTGLGQAVTLHALGTMARGPADNVTNRTLFPPLDAGATLTFDPGAEPFGIFAESQANVASLGSDGRFFQEDALNDDQGNVQPVHRVRAFPLKNRSGESVANSFLLVCEEASNSDFQDYVFVISNVSIAP
jgi:hypothetical protein